jgi:PAS domain S-box-containing protein
MELAASLPLAVATLALGAVLLVLTAAGLRWLAARRPLPVVASPVRLPVESQAPDTAVLVVQPGGRVLFANERAQQFFGLNGEAPNLSRMAQRVRPSETFLELVAAEGRASLNIGERQVEATSLHVPADDNGPGRFVIVLRETGQLPELAAGDERNVQAMTVIADISRAINASLDPRETYEAIVTHVGRALQYSVAELTLWDEAAQVLRPVQYGGDRGYEREFARAGGYHYKPGEGFSGWIAENRQPLLIGNVETSTQIRPKVEHSDFPVRSYVGVPLMDGTRFVGTLELVSYKANTYQPNDLILLSAIGADAAVAIRNAQRHSAEQQRVTELKGLAEITRALEATAEPRELYGRLSAELARLMGMQMVGFLLYNESENALIGQPPFYGVPDIVAEFYRIPLTPGSMAERVWRDEPYWLSNNVAADPLVDEAGLRQLAETAGVRTTLMAPIIAAGRRLGVVQVSNKVNGAPFTEDDVRVFTLFASQAAAILDNARLVSEAQTRAVQAEGLRQIAARAATGANVDEILRTAMSQAAELLRFDLGVILLLDEARGELAPHLPSLHGGTPEDAQTIGLRTDDPMFAFSVTRSRRPLYTGLATRDRRVVGVYHEIVEAFQVESVMNVPLLVSDRSLGEMLAAAQRPSAFSRADLQLLSTVGSQLASAIERTRLAAVTDENLRRRVDQLTALTRVGRELNQTLDLERILRLVHDESLHASRAECGTILLLGERHGDGLPAVTLRIGEEELGLALTGLEAEAIKSERPQRVSDLPPDSPLMAHPEVRSALVVPIVVQGVVGGLIHLHRHDPEGFDDAALETAGTLAAQTAIAVGNAQRYEEQKKRGELLRRRADQLAQLFQISRTVRSDLPLTINLEAIAFGLQEAVGFNIVLISVIDPQTRRLRRTAAAGIPLATFEQIRQVEQPWENFTRALREEFRISQSFFIPYERRQDLGETLDLVTLTRNVPKDWTPERWHPEDMLIVPLVGSGQEPVGIVSIDDPRDGLRPDRSTIEIVEIFANQAAIAIENDRLYQAAERRAARLLSLHRVIEQASRVADRNRLWQTMAESLQAEMSLDLCLIALQANGRLTVQGRAGETREEVDLAPLVAVPERNPLARVMTDNLPKLVASIKETDWALSPLVIATQVTSFIAAPIFSQGQPAGALLVGSRRTPTPFTPEDPDLFVILANQLGALLESARLEADVRQNAAQLAALADVSRIITATLRTEDVVQAVLAHLRSVIPYDRVTLWLRDGQRLRIAAAQGFENDAEHIGLTVEIADSALFAEMAQTGGAIVSPDVHGDPRFPAGAMQPTRSWLGAPLVSKSQIIGALALDKIEPNFYTPQAVQVLMAFANQAAIALDNARLFDESVQRARELDERTQRLGLLNRFSADLSTTLQAERIFAITLTEVAASLNVGHAAVITFDENGHANLAAQFPAGPDKRLTPASPALARVRQTLAPVFIDDVSQDPALAPIRSVLIQRGVKSLLLIPVAAAGGLLAVLQLEEVKATRHFTPGEIELAQTLANQAAVALQNARQYDETQVALSKLSQRTERLAFLNRYSVAVTASLDLRTILHDAAEQITQLFQVDHCGMVLFDDERRYGRVEAEYPDHGAAGMRILLENDPLEEELLTRRAPVVVDDTLADPRLSPGLRETFARLDIQSILITPFISQGQVIGSFSLDAMQAPRRFTAEEIELCQIIAAQTSAAITNARFAEELEARVAARTQEVERERERVEILLQITTELSSSLDLDRVLARALQLVTEAVNAPQGSIFMIDLQSDQLIYRAALGRARPLALGGEPAPFKRGEGLVGWVIKNRQPVVIDNLDTDPRWKKFERHQGRHKSALAVPLMANEDALGAMILLSPQYGAFDEDQLRLVAAAANQVGAAINNAELYRLIRDQAERLGNLLRNQQVEGTKMRSIVEGIADGVLVADADGQIILFNVACERVLGISREEIVGRPVTEFVGIYGAAGRRWIEAITQWSLDPASYRPGEFLAERLELEDQRIISVHLAPVTTGEEYLGSVSVIRDITRDVEVDRLKSEFVTNVSHELRTPMTSIKGYADILLMGAVGALNEQQAKFVEVIKDNADRMTMLVNDLLDISRIESGKAELVRRPVHIGEVLQSVIDTLRGRIDEEHKPMTLRVEAPPDLPEIVVDRERITQAIMNLAENAFSYTPAGGTVTLQARVDDERQEMVVEVTDTGMGVAPEDQPRLFDRFYRGEQALVTATAGTGLGLSIARQLTEMHGGRLWLVASEVGKGSTFALALPLNGETEGNNGAVRFYG